MISASSVLNHSESTPVVQEFTSSLFTPYAIAVFAGRLDFDDRAERREAVRPIVVAVGADQLTIEADVHRHLRRHDLQVGGQKIVAARGRTSPSAPPAPPRAVERQHRIELLGLDDVAVASARRKSRSTCGARSAMSSTGSPGVVADVDRHRRAVGLRHPADERQRPVDPLIVLQAAVRDRVEQRDVEALAERLRLELEVHRIVVRVDDARAGSPAARCRSTKATIVRSRLTAYQREPGRTSAFAGAAGHGLKPRPRRAWSLRARTSSRSWRGR